MEVLGVGGASLKYFGHVSHTSSDVGSRIGFFNSTDHCRYHTAAATLCLQQWSGDKTSRRAVLCGCSASSFPEAMAKSQSLAAHAMEHTSFEWQRYLVSFAPVVLSIAVSRKLQIGLERDIQKAAIRSFIQLLALGFSIKFFIETKQILWSCVGIIFMVLFAGRTAGKRAKRLPKSRSIATISLAFGALGIVVLMTFLGIFPLNPWFIIPTAAHVIGHSMAMLGGTMNSIHREIRLHRQQIEAALALGATPQQAVRSHVKRAFSVGMGPMVDEVKAMGLVTLPGNMTGMLMGGAGPLEAVKLQLQVINVVLGAAALSCLISSTLGWRSYFTEQHQLLTI
ncbi:hypothetical protein O6H91_07G020500 [Diphasiastrum complanatum]|uniref:Uncharacterized protein n=2 Tax=Diphasiastrum complanatum TaxID=34168 RepID=A0ACC2D3C1_DIPCM|nr:hypothetical protein O6H91_07G020500 [Diphasiastrum complanatum]KAJ7548634.1 hypothetical protein O6H91_07G020500 [Diphasiastrum complanatum]